MFNHVANNGMTQESAKVLVDTRPSLRRSNDVPNDNGNKNTVLTTKVRGTKEVAI